MQVLLALCREALLGWKKGSAEVPNTKLTAAVEALAAGLRREPFPRIHIIDAIAEVLHTATECLKWAQADQQRMESPECLPTGLAKPLNWLDEEVLRLGAARLRVLSGHPHGDHQPLTLTAADLVRVLLQDTFGIGKLDLAQQVEDPFPVGLAPRARMEAGKPARAVVLRAQLRRFPLHQVHDLGADGEDRVERAERVLRDEGDPTAAHGRGERRRIDGQQVDPVELDAAGLQPGRVLRQDAQDRAGQGGLAAAALAHQTDDLAPADGQVYVVEHLGHAAVGGEADLEVAHPQQVTCHGGCSVGCGDRGCRAGRRPAG